MRWVDPPLRERCFELEHDGQLVPGVLWTPPAGDREGPYPLVLAGHGFTTHKRALYPWTCAHDLVTRYGIAVASLDAPGHGDRQPDGGRDTAACDRSWREHWRAYGATRIAAEYSAVLAAFDAVPEIDTARVAYWGLSLGTQYGAGILAHEPRIRAAVLGLSGLPDPGPRIAAYAEQVRCPVFFIEQLDDETCPPDRAEALFDRLATADKTLRASPGRHMQVPGAVFDEAYRFLAHHLRVAVDNEGTPAHR